MIATADHVMGLRPGLRSQPVMADEAGPEQPAGVVWTKGDRVRRKADGPPGHRAVRGGWAQEGTIADDLTSPNARATGADKVRVEWDTGIAWSWHRPDELEAIDA